MIRCLGMFLLLLGPLGAQIGYVEPSRPLSLGRLKRELVGHPVVLVLCQAPGGAWDKAFDGILAEDPLADLTRSTLPVNCPAAMALYRREGWREGPHWALLDPGVHVLAEGADLPTAQALGEALASTGRKPDLPMMRDFVREHPDHAAGRLRLVELLCAKAEARTLAALGLPSPLASRPRPGTTGWIDEDGFHHSSESTDAQRLERLEGHDLPADQDEAIWGEYKEALEGVLQDEGWSTLLYGLDYRSGGALRSRVDSPLARFSPRCRDAYGRLLPRIEALLVRYPRHGWAWQLWSSFAQAVDRDPKPLMDSLQPSPGSLDWPPMALRNFLAARARRSQDWGLVVQYFGEAWERVLEIVQSRRRVEAPSKGKGHASSPWLGEVFWESTVSPLLEAHLRQGHAREAASLMETWMQHGGWPVALQAAARQARDASMESLAREWEEDYAAGSPK
jgi:hypothetical protein